MELSRIQKIILPVTFIAGALWLGGYVSRVLIGFQLFQERDYLLKDFFNPASLDVVFFSQNPILTLTLLTYPVFIVGFLIFLFTTKLKLKNNGWLFIITVIILFTAPFELYLLSIDFKIFSAVNSGVFNPNDILTLTIKRFKVLSSFPIIEIASYFAVICMFILKPFTKKTNEN